MFHVLLSCAALPPFPVVWRLLHFLSSHVPLHVCAACSADYLGKGQCCNCSADLSVYFLLCNMKHGLTALVV